MNTDRGYVGPAGEKRACELLRKSGYQIVETNYHAGRWGEIDIIARDRDTLVFIEVKTRRSSSTGLPEESVSQAKIHKLALAVQHYLARHGQEDQPFRIDVVALRLDGEGRTVYHNHIQNITF